MTEHLKTEKDVEQVFIEKLLSCDYPKDSIIHIENNRELPGDIVIKNGKRYIQAFEIKLNNNPEERKHLYQYVGNRKIQLPVYFVTPQHDGFVIYDKNSNNPLNEYDVLNYEKATDRFVQNAKKEVSKETCWLRIMCWFLSALFLGVGIFYFSKSISDSAYIWGTVAFAIIIFVAFLIPFSDKFNLDIGDLGLEIVFNQDKKTKKQSINHYSI